MPSHLRGPSTGSVQTVLDSSGNIVVYGTKSESKKGMLTQLIEKTKIKQEKRKSPGYDGNYTRNQNRRFRKSPENIKSVKTLRYSSTDKVRSLYRPFKVGSTDVTSTEINVEQHQQGEECEYQRISEASSSGEAKKRVQAEIHSVPCKAGLNVTMTKSVRTHKNQKVYPVSDSEELLYTTEKDIESIAEQPRRRASCESLSTTASGSRRSSIAETIPSTVGSKNLPTSAQDTQDTRKTLVLFIGPSSSSSLVQKQRSWETFPRPKSKRTISVGEVKESLGLGQLKKADSFEGHEEAVRTLVAAVQETRTQMRQAQLAQHRVHRKDKTN